MRPISFHVISYKVYYIITYSWMPPYDTWHVLLPLSHIAT